MIRARFAPSPTGSLHVGSARTALLNWLFVRGMPAGDCCCGSTTRTLSARRLALEAAIFEDLQWLGLDWDDGPVHQSDRIARYEEVLAELPVVRRDDAYEFRGSRDRPLGRLAAVPPGHRRGRRRRRDHRTCCAAATT